MTRTFLQYFYNFNVKNCAFDRFLSKRNKRISSFIYDLFVRLTMAHIAWKGRWLYIVYAAVGKMEQEWVIKGCIWKDSGWASEWWCYISHWYQLVNLGPTLSKPKRDQDIRRNLRPFEQNRSFSLSLSLSCCVFRRPLSDKLIDKLHQKVHRISGSHFTSNEWINGYLENDDDCCWIYNIIQHYSTSFKIQTAHYFEKWQYFI